MGRPPKKHAPPGGRARRAGRGHGIRDWTPQVYHPLSSSHSPKRTGGDTRNGSRPMNPYRPPDPLASAYLARLAEPPSPAHVEALRQLGHTGPIPRTQREASELLTHLFTRGGRRVQ